MPKELLHIAPVFSNNQDPYEKIKWKLFDAVIKNNKGEIVFEQKQVEFPEFWSQLAVNIVASKYFYGKLGTEKRERSLRQLIDRVVNFIADNGVNRGYFDGANGEAFKKELKYIMVHQIATFNSPVHFNAGIYDAYGVNDDDTFPNYYWDMEKGEVKQCSNLYKYPQCSACFILKIEDNLKSLFDAATIEGKIFRSGSGVGTNDSFIRSSKEGISGGGISSGCISFMKIRDQVASVVKSGGRSRRAAIARILNHDHPDILEFIDIKSKEEKKVRTLVNAGYDGSFNGEAYSSIFFQNANFSINVTDEFMQKVINDETYWTKFVTTGENCEELKARDVIRKIAEGTWQCGDPGMQFIDTVNKWHTSSQSGRIWCNNPCFEYLYLNNTACNLSSLNIMKFRKEDGSIDLEKYLCAIRLLIIAQEIIVDASSYPTEDITFKTHKFRTLGLGLTNIGSLLMSLGLPYDSDAGRKLAASITAILTAQAYKTSAEIAKYIGSFDGYAENANCMLDVIRMHKESAENDYKITADINKQAYDLFGIAQILWKDAYNDGIRFGYRNGQVTVFAPTGTISFFMDADTTGIEPELALVKYKLLAGSGDGMLKIVNKTVPMALDRLGYSKEDIVKIVDYIAQNDTIEGCQLIKEKDLAVFDCSFKPAKGQRSIHYMGHIKMLAACIPYLSGSISKTINMPEESTVEDIMNAYIEAWKLGCKNVAIYRDGSKRSQPLSTKKDKEVKYEVKGQEEEKKPELIAPKPKRNKPNKTRKAINHEFEISGHKFYITVGLYDDGSPCELFIKSNKSGSTINGLLDSLGISISKGLQHGVELTEYIDKFSFIKFEPYGITGDKEIPIAHSVVDYIARWLGKEFLHKKYEPEPFSPINEMHIPEQKGVNYNSVGDTGICSHCGSLTVRAGSCRVCVNCGSASGCG